MTSKRNFYTPKGKLFFEIIGISFFNHHLRY